MISEGYIKMSVYPPPPLSRDQEKAELQHLGDRVQNYIGKNRKLREDANNVSVGLSIIVL